MAKVPTSNGNKLEFSSDDITTMLYGLPFLLIGLVIIGYPYVVSGEAIPQIVALPLGGVFTLFGIFTVFGGSSATIDKGTGKITTWRGVLGLGFTLEYKISDVKMVTLTCESTQQSRQNQHAKSTHYPIILEGLEIPVNIDTAREFNEGRAIAKEIAIFLNLPMKYFSGGEEIIIEASELNQSVRQNMAAKGITPKSRPKPPGAESTHTQLGSTHTIHIPAPGFQPGHYLLMMIGVTAVLVPAILLIPKLFEKETSLMPLLFLSVAGIFSVAMLCVAVYSAQAVTEVEISPTRIVVTTNVLFYRHVETLDGEKIEELRIDGPIMENSEGQVNPGSRAILVRADEKTLTFGWWLDEAELEWLLSIAQVALSFLMSSHKSITIDKGQPSQVSSTLHKFHGFKGAEFLFPFQ